VKTRLFALLAAVAALGCGAPLGPETRLTFSFEQGMEGWTVMAADTAAIAPWSVQRSTDVAYDGQYALKFYLANYNDATKIWIVRPFPVTPGRAYGVEVSYAFASRDWTDANLFVLLTGAFTSPPGDGPALVAGTSQEPTGNGAGRDVGYQWQRKYFRTSARGDPSGALYVVVGVWGTWETPRTYYVDDVTVHLTPN
jgi:hypothetical protein